MVLTCHLAPPTDSLHPDMRSTSSGTQLSAPPSTGSASSSSSFDDNLPEFSSQSDVDSLTFDPCEGLTVGSLREAEPVRSSFQPLSQRVELNRSILQQLLRSHRALDQSERRDTGFSVDEDDSEIQQNEKHSVFVSAPLPQQQCEDRARMKRRSQPLRGDHNLLTPDARGPSGVRLCPVVQVRSEGRSLPGHLSDSSSSEAGVRTARRRPASSPNRRLRFEDETETEAESRYLERQKKRAGPRMQDILVSKPDASLYVNGRVGVGLHRAGLIVDRQQTGVSQTLPGGGGVDLTLRLHPTPPIHSQGRNLYLVTPNRPRLNLRTEPIRETYIGTVTPTDDNRGGGAGPQGSSTWVRRRANQVELNGIQVTPPSELPINPYAPDQLATPPSQVLAPPPPTSVTATESQRLNKNHSKKNKNQNQNLDREEQGKSAPQREAELRRGLAEDSGLESTVKTSSSSTAETQAPPTSDRQVKEPMRRESHSADATPSEEAEASRLSLRRLFSSVRLGRSRTGSLDRCSSRPRPPAPDPASPSPMKKTPSLQSLSVGSPFLKLRKSASLQSFVSEQKKKDRSENYRAAAESNLQRCLSVEDVGAPSALRSVGRILQLGSDGTILLELSRPTSRTFGFIISRGRGRADSGVYVEDMVDFRTEKLYAGLLGVGDEILEVNEEKVACLSLDQVTHMLTQGHSVTVRVLRRRRPQPPR